MIFEFQLIPIEEVQPWGEPPNQKLSWFGFTDGEYRMKVGAEYLLDYSEEYTKHLIEKFPDYSFRTTFIEYQVVRFWEDILEMLPSILEPVLKEIQYFLISGYESYLDLQNNLLNWQDSEILKGVKENDTLPVSELAIYWLDNRRIDCGYLTNSARVCIWSDENDVVFSWDNRNIKVENIPVWSATYGNYRITKGDFINEVRKFDSSLISQMNERVEKICRMWNKPEIKVDFDYLKSEQKNRATWFEIALKNVRKTDWNEVVSAIKTINP